MAVIIGLFVAGSFGTADFLGGLASRRASTLAVLAFAQLCALIGAVVVAFLAGGPLTAHDLAFGALAGVLNLCALGCLYRGFAVGQIAQVAPVAAVIGATIPVGWGLATGERPTTIALVGVAIAILAGGLLSRGGEEEHGPFTERGLALAVAAGVGFGTSFICFAAASHNSSFWPVLTGRCAAVLAIVAALVVTRTSLSIDRTSRTQAVTAGVFDVTATALLLVALRAGLATTVAPVVALAPGFSVTHAWWYLRERASPIQLVGLALALVGLLLIGIGSVAG